MGQKCGRVRRTSESSNGTRRFCSKLCLLPCKQPERLWRKRGSRPERGRGGDCGFFIIFFNKKKVAIVVFYYFLFLLIFFNKKRWRLWFFIIFLFLLIFFNKKRWRLWSATGRTPSPMLSGETLAVRQP